MLWLDYSEPPEKVVKYMQITWPVYKQLDGSIEALFDVLCEKCHRLAQGGQGWRWNPPPWTEGKLYLMEEQWEACCKGKRENEVGPLRLATEGDVRTMVQEMVLGTNTLVRGLDPPSARINIESATKLDIGLETGIPSPRMLRLT
jgi:hypothetical protein